jgi:hypothetical protein
MESEIALPSPVGQSRLGSKPASKRRDAREFRSTRGQTLERADKRPCAAPHDFVREPRPVLSRPAGGNRVLTVSALDTHAWDGRSESRFAERFAGFPFRALATPLREVDNAFAGIASKLSAPAAFAARDGPTGDLLLPTTDDPCGTGRILGLSEGSRRVHVGTRPS